MFILSVLSIFSEFFNNKNFPIINNTVLFNSDDKKTQPTNPQPVQCLSSGLPLQATGWGRGKVESPVSHAPPQPQDHLLRGCAIHHRALQASVPLGGALLPTSTCRASSSQCPLQLGPVRVRSFSGAVSGLPSVFPIALPPQGWESRAPGLAPSLEHMVSAESSH